MTPWTRTGLVTLVLLEKRLLCIVKLPFPLDTIEVRLSSISIFIALLNPLSSLPWFQVGHNDPKTVNSLAEIAGHEGDEEPWNVLYDADEVPYSPPLSSHQYQAANCHSASFSGIGWISIAISSLSFNFATSRCQCPKTPISYRGGWRYSQA